MNVVDTAIDAVKILEPRVFEDERGCFFESFNLRRFRECVDPSVEFVQDNHSVSNRGVLRGLHFQASHPQGKLVRVVAGAVFDVAVDIRRDSPHFGQWVGETLSAENRRQLWVPGGFAHGFLTLSDTAHFLYKTTEYYYPDDERCIVWDDTDIAIEWPMDADPVLSDKDRQAPTLAQQFDTP
ncbi:MAG: dTDP-4-dehydrorhamnose 3,5-epimerase [Pseudomonadota bacterium]